MAYGSPNSLNDVAPYLAQVRSHEPTREQIERLTEKYRQVGGKTPLLQITQEQATGLKNRLHALGVNVPVYFGMKHWIPFIEDVVHEIITDGSGSITGIALAPHYSRLSIGGYEAAVQRGLSKNNSNIPFTMVKSWHNEEHLIKLLSRRVSEGLDAIEWTENTVVLFTAHSLPKTAVDATDPYQTQLHETSRLVAKHANVELWDFAYQSAGEPKESWLGPHILSKVKSLVKDEGYSQILVCPIGFVSDHLEVLYDLDIEAKKYAKGLGARLERTVSLNDDPEFIDALASVALSTIKPHLVSMPL